eukprot:GFUD01029652.1.p1 GENE.GFUD01029652.1~~GFUD01029652.1.p1  ORF type:complete len:425 (+),score=142.05 GFUD01029652.1:80-1354(+)
MPSLSHPDLAVATVGGLPGDVEVIPEGEGEVPDGGIDAQGLAVPEPEVFQDDSSDSSGISEPSVSGDTGETLFSPALYLQRYQAVLQYLSASSIQSVLDTGCNNCKFMKLLQNLPEVRLVAGMDIDRGLLEEQAKYLAPLPADWLHGRDVELLMEVWWGSVGDIGSAKVMSGRVQGVTSIELIEHLDQDTLEQFHHTVLGEVKPMVWVVTTPNREYNTLFPEWIGPFRHWDHRFEWDRKEFRDWALKVVSQYKDYSVEFGGVGFTEGCEDSHGPASQIAVFRKEEWMERIEIDQETKWKKVAKYTFPKKVDNRSREEKIYDEVIYYARMVAVDIREREEVEGNVLVQLEELLRFDGLKRVTEDLKEIGQVLMKKGHELDKEQLCVVVEAESEVEDDEEYEFSFNDTEEDTNCVQVDENVEEDWA